MPKYKTKPNIKEALQWTGENENDIKEFVGGSYGGRSPLVHMVFIKTLEGNLTAGKGDFIVKGIKGEFYPVKEDIFNNSYEKLED